MSRPLNQKTAFRVVVTTTDPMFIYCGFPSHCQNGMTAVVNPNGSQTLEAHRLAAREVDRTIVPDGVFGGQLVAATEGSPTPPSAGSGSSGSGGPEVNAAAAAWALAGGSLGVGGGSGAFVVAVVMMMMMMIMVL
jgi:hypothetical protein